MSIGNTIGSAVPNPPPAKYIIHADIAAMPPKQIASRRAFHADQYNITVDASKTNAVVTHSRNGAAGVTLRVSGKGTDYQAVRIHKAEWHDDTVAGQYVEGVAVAAGGVVTPI